MGLSEEIPLTNEKIVTTVSKLKERFTDNKNLNNEQQEHFISFFDEIQQKLLSNKKIETVNDIFDEKLKNK